MSQSKMKFKRLVLVGLCMMVPVLAFAQASTAEDILTQTSEELGNIAGYVINIVSIVMGLIGAAMLAVNLTKYFKGDPSSNDALTKIGGGLLIAVIILQIIRITLLRGV